MEIANSMRGITENIVASYNARVEALGDLVFDTHKTLRGFISARKKMAREQAEGLANFAKDLSKSVEDMLKRFRENHKQMSEEQARGLTDFIKNLIKDVGSILNGFHKDRGKMSKELKGRLSKEVKEVEAYVQGKLEEFKESHTEMSEKQKATLARFVSGMANEVKKVLTRYRADMVDCRKDINKASSTWKGMAASLARAKKGNPAKLKVGFGGMATKVEGATEKKGKRKAK
jgi:hypothetical protein